LSCEPTPPSNFSRAILETAGSSIDLFKAALAIAADQYPNLDESKYDRQIDSISAHVKSRIDGLTSPEARLTAINSVLFEELRFAGNTRNYFDPRNSYLNEVIDRRTGIPITLSVIYIEIAKRVGVSLEGVGMPFHFLVKHSGEADIFADIFIDPFNAGKLMDRSDCAALLDKLSGGSVSLLPEHLEAVSPAQILIRMLANLAGIYIRQSDFDKALRFVDNILLIDPICAPYVRDKALLLGALGRWKLAATAYERYVRLAPGAADAETVKDRLAEMRRDRARLN